MFSLDRKLETNHERKQVSFIWERCLPAALDEFLKLQDNYVFISTQTLNFQKCYNIVQKFIENDEKNFPLLQESIKKHFTEIRYVFAILFSKIFCRVNLTGIKIKSNFDYGYYNWENDSIQKAKDVTNYTDGSTSRHENEQNIIKKNDVIPVDDILSKSYQMTLKPEKRPKVKTPKEKFDSDRIKAQQKKREQRKRQLEEQLEESNRQLAMIKPVTSNKKKLIIK